jgi:hypothetical protein
MADGSAELIYAISEWNGTLDQSASLNTQNGVTPFAMTGGGAVTPGSADPATIIAFLSVAQGSDEAVVSAIVADGNSTELTKQLLAGTTTPHSWVGYREVASPSGAYAAGAVGTAGDARPIYWSGVTASLIGSEAAWVIGSPLTVDGDPATYTAIAGMEMLRVDLGAPFRILSTLVRIATETAGARVLTIKGANTADFSDEVTLGTIGFTATGSFTAQNVPGSWYTEDSYQYFQLDIDVDETNRVHSWELYEGTLATNHEHDTPLGDISDVDLDPPPNDGDVLAYDAGSGTWAPVAPGSSVDHGALSGLGDDDHTQYVLRSILTTRGDLFRRGAAAIERVGLGTNGQVLTSDGTDAVWAAPPAASVAGTVFAIVAVFDGGGSAITGNPEVDIVAPADGDIVEAILLADQTGDAVVDVWRDSYANYPATDADSITSGTPPTISGGVKSSDTSLTGWTTAFSAGDVFRVHLDSSSTVERLTLTLLYERT